MDVRDGFLIAVEEKMQTDGITRKELADRCDYAEETINRIMEKSISVSIDTAVKLSAALGLSLDEVCGIIKRPAE